MFEDGKVLIAHCWRELVVSRVDIDHFGHTHQKKTQFFPPRLRCVAGNGRTNLLFVERSALSNRSKKSDRAPSLTRAVSSRTDTYGQVYRASTC